MFPISRDPPEGGTNQFVQPNGSCTTSFQFLGIPPKGEREGVGLALGLTDSFQFLGIPPKGELEFVDGETIFIFKFPISRDPPEGGT